MSRALDRGQQPIAPSALGTGTPGSGNFLRGDGAWETISTEVTRQALDAELTTMLIEGTYKNQPRWFFSSGSHTIEANVLHMIMVVGGGGGGGQAGGSNSGLGGNGADLVIKWVKPTANTALTITIGAGGTAGTSNGVAGNNGANSTVVGTGINIIATGGRGGSATQDLNVRHRNSDNPASTGGDYVAKGGRTRNSVLTYEIGGSSLFGNIGGIAAGGGHPIGATINYSFGDPFYDFDTNTGIASIQSPIPPEIAQAIADASAINNYNNGTLALMYPRTKKTIFDLLLPANFIQVKSQQYSSGNSGNGSVANFSSNIGAGGSRIGGVGAFAAGPGAGGVGGHFQNGTDGGSGFVVIWSFANV
jgi:hypothetical protein